MYHLVSNTVLFNCITRTRHMGLFTPLHGILRKTTEKCIWYYIGAHTLIVHYNLDIFNGIFGDIGWEHSTWHVWNWLDSELVLFCFIASNYIWKHVLCDNLIMMLLLSKMTQSCDLGYYYNYFFKYVQVWRPQTLYSIYTFLLWKKKNTLRNSGCFQILLKYHT
jgi:hypothetical protein